MNLLHSPTRRLPQVTGVSSGVCVRRLQRPRRHQVRLYPVISRRAFAAEVCQAVPGVLRRYSVFKGQGQLPSRLRGARQELPNEARDRHGWDGDRVCVVGCRDEEVVDLVVVHEHGNGICCLCVGNLHDGMIMIMMIITTKTTITTTTTITFPLRGPVKMKDEYACQFYHSGCLFAEQLSRPI
jgi:hypothetical protein